MIKDLDELTAFLKICRKQGVMAIKFEGLSVDFGELPKKSRKEDDADDATIATEELSGDELIYYSAGVTDQ